MNKDKEIQFLCDLKKLIEKHDVNLIAKAFESNGWIEVAGSIKLSFDDPITPDIIENKIYMIGETK